MTSSEPAGLDRLLATWQAWNGRDVLARAADRAATTGDGERAATLHALIAAQEERGVPLAIEALAAQHELATQLEGWRWQTVAAAREQGASWDDIAAATGTTYEISRTEYAMEVERAEQAATAAGVAFDQDRYRGALIDGPDDELDSAIASTEELPMPDRTHNDSNIHGEDALAEAPGWPTPDPTLPIGQLTDRELIARAERCDEITHTGSPSDQAAARRDLDATWAEAERRADGHPAVSIPAQVAGYIGLVREDYDHALAAESAMWRRQLDHALRPLEIDDPGPRQVIPTAHVLAADQGRLAPAWAWQRDGGRELTLEERADRAQSLAQGARVDVAGYDPDADVYTDPDPGQVVRLDGRTIGAATLTPADDRESNTAGDVARDDRAMGDWDAAFAIAERDGHVAFDPAAPDGFRALTVDEHRALTEQVRATQPAPWSADQHAAYLDDRPSETTPYNPAAEYGDPDWREPASDAEAASRTAWLAEHTAPATGWTPRPLTEVEDALQDAGERAVLSDRAHDSDPYGWAEYHRLDALADLAPLPTSDALDDLPRDEQAEPDASAPLERHDDQLDGPGDPQWLRQRIEGLRATLAAQDMSVEGEGEERREQLARWHENDHRAPDTAEARGIEIADDGADEGGWGR